MVTNVLKKLNKRKKLARFNKRYSKIHNVQLKQASPTPVSDLTTINDHKFGMKLAVSVAQDQKNIPITKINL